MLWKSLIRWNQRLNLLLSENNRIKPTTEVKVNDDDNLIIKQSRELEEEMNSVKRNVNGMGNRVFKMREVILGSKKTGTDIPAVKDPETGNIIVNKQLMK